MDYTNFNHKKQKRVWENEHENPTMFPHLAENEVSGGVKRFWKMFCEKNLEKGKSRFIGLEIGCGKGRNSIWLAEQGATVYGFDFSRAAIKVAHNRIHEGIVKNISFIEHDAMELWPFESASFDFVVDCFTSTDIEDEDGRKFVRSEIFRVLKPSGNFFLYTNSSNSEICKKMSEDGNFIHKKNSYFYPESDKFEKVYDLKELERCYKKFKLVYFDVFERDSMINNQKYKWEHFWMVYQKSPKKYE